MKYLIPIAACIILSCSFLLGGTPVVEQSALRMYGGSAAQKLDPGVIRAEGTGGGCIPLLFSSLTTTDGEGKLAPGLAESWDTSADGLRWTFHLRPDAAWVRLNPKTGAVESQRAVTSGDVINGLRDAFTAGAASASEGSDGYSDYLSYIVGARELLAGTGLVEQLGVKAVDDRTVEVDLIAPIDEFPLGDLIYAVPEELILMYGDKWTEPANIWTSGPYVMESWEHDTKMVLRKNPLYPDAAANAVDRIEIVEGIAPTEALEIYKKGGLDVVQLQPEDLPAVRGDPQLSEQLYHGPQVNVAGLLFNTAKPPFNNRLALKAFEHAVDRAAINDMGGRGDLSFCGPPAGVTWNVYHWWKLGYNPTLAKEEWELSGWPQARAWQDDAGYPEGTGLDLILMYDKTANGGMEEIVRALQAGWKELLGVEVLLTSVDGEPEPDVALLLHPVLAYDRLIEDPGALYLIGPGGVHGLAQAAWLPLACEFTDSYLVTPARQELVGQWGGPLFNARPALSWRATPPPAPSASELTQQCINAIGEAKQPFEEHDCETSVPKAEDAVLKATEALSMDDTDARAYYCRGEANYYLGRMPEALEDLGKAQELGGAGYGSELATRLRDVRAIVEAPACPITPVQFIEGWEGGEPVDRSPNYTARDPTKIQVYWEQLESCDTVCRVLWKTEKDGLVCWHPYGSADSPHKQKEGSQYYNDDGGPLASGTWSVEVWCGDTKVGEARATIP